MPEAYAESLRDYAAGRLEPAGLRAWIVWRLIVDGGLDHEQAEAVAATAIAQGCDPAGRRLSTPGRRGPRRPHRPHRPRRPPAGRLAA
jgi:hypothetical protein